MVVWSAEEGVAFNRGVAGSRIVAGDMRLTTWNRSGTACGARTRSGRSAAIPTASWRRIGRRARGTAIWSCTSSKEERSNGPTLAIGVVEGIVAIERYEATILGLANHAGTTPMADRQDALIAASQLTTGRETGRDIASRDGRSAPSADSR